MNMSKALKYGSVAFLTITFIFSAITGEFRHEMQNVGFMWLALGIAFEEDKS